METEGKYNIDKLYLGFIPDTGEVHLLYDGMDSDEEMLDLSDCKSISVSTKCGDEGFDSETLIRMKQALNSNICYGWISRIDAFRLFNRCLYNYLYIRKKMEAEESYVRELNITGM